LIIIPSLLAINTAENRFLEEKKNRFYDLEINRGSVSKNGHAITYILKLKTVSDFNFPKKGDVLVSMIRSHNIMEIGTYTKMKTK